MEDQPPNNLSSQLPHWLSCPNFVELASTLEGIKDLAKSQPVHSGCGDSLTLFQLPTACASLLTEYSHFGVWGLHAQHQKLMLLWMAEWANPRLLERKKGCSKSTYSYDSQMSIHLQYYLYHLSIWVTGKAWANVLECSHIDKQLFTLIFTCVGSLK